MNKPSDHPIAPETNETPQESQVDKLVKQKACHALNQYLLSDPETAKLFKANGNEPASIDRTVAEDTVAQKLKEFVVGNSQKIEELLVKIPDHKRDILRLATSINDDVAHLIAESVCQIFALKLQADMDGLLGIPNRKAYEKRLALAIESNSRYGDTFSAMIFDLDHFKLVNDQYGHQAGDEVLRETGRRINKMAGLHYRSTNFGRHQSHPLQNHHQRRAGVDDSHFSQHRRFILRKQNTGSTR